MTDDTELVRRVCELAGWFTRDNWSENEAIPLGKTYVVLAGTLTDSGLIVLIEELLRAGWHPQFDLDGDHSFYWVPSIGEEYVADTLAKATMLAYCVYREQK